MWAWVLTISKPMLIFLWPLKQTSLQKSPSRWSSANWGKAETETKRKRQKQRDREEKRQRKEEGGEEKKREKGFHLVLYLD